MTAADLVVARAEATARYLTVANMIKVAAGIVSHDISGLNDCRTWPRERRIVAPEGRTRLQLYALAIECGRVALYHVSEPARVPHDRDARKWARQALSYHGVEIPKTKRWRKCS